MYRVFIDYKGQTHIYIDHPDGSMETFQEHEEHPKYQAYQEWIAQGNTAPVVDERKQST